MSTSVGIETANIPDGLKERSGDFRAAEEEAAPYLSSTYGAVYNYNDGWSFVMADFKFFGKSQIMPAVTVRVQMPQGAAQPAAPEKNTAQSPTLSQTGTR